jgi:hypothetical protein
MLHNCTDTQPGVCWPCEAGFMCNTTSRLPCADAWSPPSSSVCFPCSGACPSGTVAVRECVPSSDRVCAPCPEGFGCENGTMVPRLNATGCAPGEFAVGQTCRACPDGYGCAGEQIELCAADTYSLQGACVPCGAHSHSPRGSGSGDDCVCDAGYVKTPRCSACSEGTVWVDGRCVLCDAGDYCLGRTHRERCPVDMYSERGSAACVECRPFSNCQRLCAGPSSCACDDGYVPDAQGNCTRCKRGTAKSGEASCGPCPPGMECQGGAEVAACGLSTYSPGNLSRCAPCTLCPELTRARCNSTHDSVCARTLEPLAVITVRQEYRTRVYGDTFGLFAMIYTSALPQAQLQGVCDDDHCVRCFQGICPLSQMRTLSGPVYAIAIEIRSKTNRLVQNVEALTSTAFLLEAAKTAMRKVTEAPFEAATRVEHLVICPTEGDEWDGGACVGHQGSSATAAWVAFLLGIAVLVAVMAYGRRRREE